MTDKIPVLPKGPDDKTLRGNTRVFASINDLGLPPTASEEPSQAEPSFGEMLSRVAHAAPMALGSVVEEQDQDQEIDEDTEGRKKQVAKKPFVPADSDVLRLVRSDTLTFLQQRIQGHTNKINEFLLKEIAPRTLAVDLATRQAPEALKRALDPDDDLEIEIDKTLVMKLREFSGRAANLSLAKFVVSLFGLDEEDVNLMLGNRGANKGDDDIMSALRTLLKEKENEPPRTGKGAVPRPNA